MRQRKLDDKFPKISWESSFNKPKIDVNKLRKFKEIYSNEIEPSSQNYLRTTNDLFTSSKDITLESIMAASPKKYFYSVVNEEKLTHNTYSRKKNYFNNDKSYSIRKNDDEIHNKSEKACQEQKIIREKKNDIPFENLEFLKKIYKPRKQSTDRVSELKNAVRTRLTQQNSNKDIHSDREHFLNKKNNNFRIKSEKSNITKLESENSLKKEDASTHYLPLNDFSIGKMLKKKIKALPNEKNNSNINEKITQNATYKMIQTKKLNDFGKNSKEAEEVVNKSNEQSQKNSINNKIQAQNLGNQVTLTNQPNSFNISVNLKPTFHLSLNSNMQSESLKNILSTLQMNSTDIQIIHENENNDHLQGNNQNNDMTSKVEINEKQSHPTAISENYKNNQSENKCKNSLESKNDFTENKMANFEKNLKKSTSLKNHELERNTFLNSKRHSLQKIQEEKQSIENFDNKTSIKDNNTQSKFEDIQVENIKTRAKPKSVTYTEQIKDLYPQNESELNSDSAHSLDIDHLNTQHYTTFNAIQSLNYFDVQNKKEENIPIKSKKTLSSSNVLDIEDPNNKSFDLVHTFNKKHSQEEKVALKIDLKDLKSQIEVISNNLTIPQISKQLTSKNISKCGQSTPIDNEIKMFGDSHLIKKGLNFGDKKKLSFDFKSKNKIYQYHNCKLHKKNAIKNNKKAHLIDNNFRNRRSLYISHFEENQSKFLEKLKNFYEYHQNPFFYEDQAFSIKEMNHFKSKFSLLQDSNSINLSEVLSQNIKTHILNKKSENEDNSFLSNESSDNENDESVYNFNLKNTEEAYTIKINAPGNINSSKIYEEEPSFTNSINNSPIVRRRISGEISRLKSEKILKNIVTRKNDDSMDQKKKKIHEKFQVLFEEINKKTMKIFQVYNYSKVWRVFKTLFFMNLHIFLSANYYEFITKEIFHIFLQNSPILQKKLILQKQENLVYGIRPEDKLLKESFDIKQFHNGKTTIFCYDCNLGDEIITNEKLEESIMKKSMVKLSENDDEADSPLFLWDHTFKYSIIFDDKLQHLHVGESNSNMSFDKFEDDEHENENDNENHSMKLSTGIKIEIFNISFKSDTTLHKYLNQYVLAYITSLDLKWKNSFQLQPQFFSEASSENFNIEIDKNNKKLIWKEKFINNAIKSSKKLQLQIKNYVINHDLISKGGFEDFIFIPQELITISSLDQLENNKGVFDSSKKLEINQSISDKRKTSRKFSRLKLTIFRSNFPADEALKTSPNTKNRRFFEVPMVAEEKTTCQKPSNIDHNSKNLLEQNDGKNHSIMQRTQRKSLSYIIPKNKISKKLIKSKASKNIFQIPEQNETSHISSNKADRESLTNIPLNQNNFNEGQHMSFLNFPNSKISIHKPDNIENDKLVLRRNSASLKKNETNISIEKNLLTIKNENQLKNNKTAVIMNKSNNMTEKSPQKKFSESSRSFIAEEESSIDKMERGSIYCKTLILYENQRKYMSIFEEMKWAVINNKLSELQHLISKYSCEYIDKQDENGNTLLMYSVINGNIAITNYLILKGANLNLQNNEGNTALHYAISYDNDDIADLLISMGVNQSIVNKEMKTPWDLTSTK